MSTDQHHAHCTYCGRAFDNGQPWPRACGNCGNTTYRNPLPVAVALVPVAGGLLGIRRAVPPGVGELALPGGYINLGETWQEAAARELLEETAVRIDPGEVSVFRVLSVRAGFLMVFGLAGERTEAELPPFEPNDETTERLILRGAQKLAFETHTDVLRAYFESTGR